MDNRCTDDIFLTRGDDVIVGTFGIVLSVTKIYVIWNIHEKYNKMENAKYQTELYCYSKR